MKSLKAIFCLVVFVLVVSTVFVYATQVQVTTAQANIRLKPDTQSTILLRVPLGTVLDVIKKEGNWYYVQLSSSDKNGFMVSGYIHQSIVGVVEKIKEISKEEKVKDEKSVEPQKPRKQEVKEETVIASKKRTLIDVGVKSGINMANISGDIPDRKGTKNGYCIGGHVELSRSNIKELAIRVECLLTQKGSRFRNMAGVDTYYLTYLEIPVLVKANFGNSKKSFRPFVYIGPYFAIKLEDKFRSEYFGYHTLEIEDRFKDSDFGFVLGGGVDFRFKFLRDSRITVELRGTGGIIDIYEDSHNLLNSFNKVISLTIGYSFSII